MYRVVKRSKKEGAVVTWLRREGIGSDRPFKLLTKFLGLLSCSTKNKMEEKGKGQSNQNHTKSDLRKSYWSMMIMHIIFGLMENDLQNQFMTYLWFGIKTKTLAYVKLYTPCAVFLCLVGPSVSSNVLLETKYKCLKSHLWLWEILFVCFHSPLVALCFEKKNVCCSDWFGGLFLY